MKIVIAQHKGGVGKTTLSVHVAGLLSERELEDVLLIDCDTQADSFYFFDGDYPIEKMDLSERSALNVLWNPDRTSLAKKGVYSEYDHIVVDIDTKIQNAMQVIEELNPDIVLIPVDDQYLALHHLYETIDFIKEIEGRFVYPLQIIIVPMGVDDASFSEIQAVADNFAVPVSQALPYLRSEFNNSFRHHKYIWEIYPEISNTVKNIIRGVYE